MLSNIKDEMTKRGFDVIEQEYDGDLIGLYLWNSQTYELDATVEFEREAGRYIVRKYKTDNLTVQNKIVLDNPTSIDIYNAIDTK